ncbi:TPA: acyltransferase family protein [Streptococcus suis]
MKIRNRGIDSLKGLSILAILIYHFSPAMLKGGYIGVPLFFLIAGYLIANNTVKRDEKGNFSLKKYYTDRILRIYPNLLIFLGFISLWAYFFAPGLLYGSASEFMSIVFGYNNFWQISQNLSYFDRVANASAFTHLWFLAIQLQFYALWPFVYFAYRKLKERWNRAESIFLVIAILSMLGMTIGYLVKVDLSTLYYHSFTRLSALMIGVWMGLGLRPKLVQKLSFDKQNTFFVYIVIIASNLLFAFLLDGQSANTYIWGLNFVTLTQAIWLFFTSQAGKDFPKLADNPVFAWFGTRSYELYLWHYAIFFLYRIKKIDNPLWIFSQFVLLLILVEGTYRLGNWMAKIQNWKRPDQAKVAYIAIACSFIAYIGLSLAVVVPLAKPQEKTDLQGQLAENSQLVANQNLSTSQTTSSVVTNGDIPTDQTTTSTSQVVDINQLPITMIGDSVLLGTFKELKATFPNSYIDAQESRQAWDLPTLLNQMIWDGNLADVVVIALGTNGYFSHDSAEEIMNILGPDRTVFWVNVYGVFLEWETATNEEINYMASLYPNLHVIDWQSQVSQNPDWLIEDGIHPDIIGRQAYARIVEESIRAVLQ